MTENAPTADAEHICIVDDDADIRTLLAEYLGRNGLRVGTFADGRSLRRFLHGRHVDLVILDVMLPDEDGLAICRWLKAETDLPVLMLTARDGEIDRILGLEMGADDYVCKPFNPRELLARIRNLLRLTAWQRQGHRPPVRRQLQFHGCMLDAAGRVLVSPAGRTWHLSACECALLHALATHANTVLSRNDIANIIHGRDAGPHDRSIDVHVSRLRRILGDNARDPRMIRTVYGRGYMLEGSVVAA